MLRAEIPELFLKTEFNANSLAAVVNHYVGLGQMRTVNELVAIGSFYENGKTDDIELDKILETREDLDLLERVGWVCRVLFEAKPNKALREPRFGGLLIPFLTMPAKNWPLFPIAHSGHTYFVLGEGYGLAGGEAESTRHYLEYCRKNGVFKTERIPLPTREQAKADAIALWNSPAWKVIKWTDKALNVEYTFPEGNTRHFIEQQYETIVNDAKVRN